MTKTPHPVSTRSLTAASIQVIILSILRCGDSYGYDIIQEVHDLSDGSVEWGAGSLYPVLHRIKARGWIKDYWVEPEGERRRRYYSITPLGLAALETETREWMTIYKIIEHLKQRQPKAIHA